LNYAHICDLQQQDKQLLALQVKYQDNYVNLQLDDNVDDIFCHKKDPTQPDWKIALPESMVVDTVKWFHQVMGHPGEKRLQEMLNQRYYHPRFCYHIDKLKCKDYQKHKLAGCDYGLLPKQEVRIAPREEVAINLIEPWKVKVNGQQVELNALTCIDMASHLVMLIIRQPNTYVTTSHKVGFVDTLTLYNAYMTRAVNSSDRTFNGYWKSLVSRMYSQPAKSAI
jgi:hypothetical protein